MANDDIPLGIQQMTERFTKALGLYAPRRLKALRAIGRATRARATRRKKAGG